MPLLPWTPKECYRPLIPLLIAYDIMRGGIPAAQPRHGGAGHRQLAAGGRPRGRDLLVAAQLFRERFTVRMLRGQYWEMRRELTDARRIHESLFPKTINTGPIRLDYTYEPSCRSAGTTSMRGSPPPGSPTGAVEPPAFNVVLLDVTGHGIAAALTVNRLYGELERLFAENPNARPGDVLQALNRYVHLTLANHSIYATAMCIRIDQARGSLEYASGGHPPAFLRGADGTIEELTSTALLLGAAADEDYEAAPVRHRFEVGDTLVAYTDGAIEARNEAGRALGVVGIQRILASASKQGLRAGQWISAILASVEAHRDGPPSDDTLLVEVSRAIPATDEGRRAPDSSVNTATQPAGAARGSAG